MQVLFFFWVNLFTWFCKSPVTAHDQSLQESQIEFRRQKVGEDVGGLCLGPSWIDDDDKHEDGDDDDKKRW